MTAPVVRVSQQFAKDFERVAAHYRCAPDELEIMRELARGNLEAAEDSFALMAAEIGTPPALGDFLCPVCSSTERHAHPPPLPAAQR